MTPELSVRVVEARLEADGVLGLALVTAGGAALPPWTPGAHLDLCLPSGLVRHYSLCGDPGRLDEYRIAVLREPNGRGGSAEVHTTQLVGATLRAVGPRNHFPLVDAPAYLFVAGGIGITPILPMLDAVGARRPWRLVYGGRRLGSMAFLDRVRERRDGSVTVVPEDTHGRPDLAAALAGLAPGTAVYCCGPDGLLRAMAKECAAAGVADRLHVERFSPAGNPAPIHSGGSFEVRLARSNRTLTVPADRSILSVVLDALPDVPHDCQEGFCGTCETAVLGGTPEHHDTILSEAERAEGDTMMICVGRSATPTLVLDL